MADPLLRARDDSVQLETRGVLPSWGVRKSTSVDSSSAVRWSRNGAASESPESMACL